MELPPPPQPDMARAPTQAAIIIKVRRVMFILLILTFGAGRVSLYQLLQGFEADQTGVWADFDESIGDGFGFLFGHVRGEFLEEDFLVDLPGPFAFFESFGG